jgi:hypothetical protein
LGSLRLQLAFVQWHLARHGVFDRDKCQANGCSSVGIDVGPDAQTFLELFGTGIRGRSSLANVTATIGGEHVDVLFAGAQGQFPGLDQVNLTLSQGLHTRGETDVVLTVDGQVANRVRVNLKDHQP